MSRIGKLPIQIPQNVSVSQEAGVVRVKGPLGELSQIIPKLVSVNIDENSVVVTIPNPEKKDQKIFWGTARALINNMVQGVTLGFSKQLELNGVGYKVAMEGNNLALALGFSHPVKFIPPQGITLSVEKNVIAVKGIDKQMVGEVAAKIRRLKKPEPYKGKGIKYSDEIIRRKAGKQVKK